MPPSDAGLWCATAGLARKVPVVSFLCTASNVTWDGTSGHNVSPLLPRNTRNRCVPGVRTCPPKRTFCFFSHLPDSMYVCCAPALVPSENFSDNLYHIVPITAASTMCSRSWCKICRNFLMFLFFFCIAFLNAFSGAVDASMMRVCPTRRRMTNRARTISVGITGR